MCAARLLLWPFRTAARVLATVTRVRYPLIGDGVRVFSLVSSVRAARFLLRPFRARGRLLVCLSPKVKRARPLRPDLLPLRLSIVTDRAACRSLPSPEELAPPAPRSAELLESELLESALATAVAAQAPPIIRPAASMQAPAAKRKYDGTTTRPPNRGPATNQTFATF